MVIAMSVIGALKEPALTERVANQTWDTGIGTERRIIVRVDARASGSWKQKLLNPCTPHLRKRDVGHTRLVGTSRGVNPCPVPVLCRNIYTHRDSKRFSVPVERNMKVSLTDRVQLLPQTEFKLCGYRSCFTLLRKVRLVE